MGMSILTWIAVGLIAGWLASKVVKGHGSGLIPNLIIGVVGALLGGWIAGFLNLGVSVSGFNWQTLLVAFGGSVLLLLILKLIRKR
jgi:uncharacterized membrane protein YeaQ/YmgE (transglycosylase-associated protein family)